MARIRSEFITNVTNATRWRRILISTMLSQWDHSMDLSIHMSKKYGAWILEDFAISKDYVNNAMGTKLKENVKHDNLQSVS